MKKASVSVTVPDEEGPVCFLTPLRRMPGYPAHQISYCPFPVDAGEPRLLSDLHTAPQFSQIRPERLLDQARGALGVILLTESDYYARQAAVYLASLAAVRRGGMEKRRADDFWEGLDLSELEDTEDAPAKLTRRSLAVISPSLLDPELDRDREEGRMAVPMGPRQLRAPSLDKLAFSAVLITAPHGPALTGRVVEEIGGRDPQSAPMDIFVAVKPDQVDLELLEELRFSLGFQVCRVGLPDRAYLRRVLRAELEELLLSAEGVDLDRVIDHTRSLRGPRFEETDLEKAALWALQRRDAHSALLSTEELLFQPLRLQKQAAEKLEGMVGLEEVKDTARRLTARAVMEERRRVAGRRVVTACRNLAFAGPPGTGKSVVARLLAQLLREAGVGSGRFVEAGREQLIGRYLGQTSPMIARLFRDADGGVLFLDEAGALLGGEQDSYANEAVNALVRHMELNPQTVVIFATYPREMTRLLSSNPGLSSRVARVLDFPAYGDEQLWDILTLLAGEEDFVLPREAREDCLAFFSDLRRRKGEDFGNGREARRLFQAAVEEMALRGESEALSAGDLRAAARGLLAQSGEPAKRSIGF